MHTYTVEPLYVPSGEETIAADFYLPKTNIKPAVILMAHGFAGLRMHNDSLKLDMLSFYLIIAIGGEAQENRVNWFHLVLN